MRNEKAPASKPGLFRKEKRGDDMRRVAQGKDGGARVARHDLFAPHATGASARGNGRSTHAHQQHPGQQSGGDA